jgi:hypothetical protein
MSENTTIDNSDLNVIPQTAEVKEADATPSVEVKDGKVYVNGVRTYTRDETNKIAANAKQEAVKGVLSDLDVDSLEQVKTAVQGLRTISTEGNTTLNIDQLRDAVKRKEQTVDELQAKVKELQHRMVENTHLSELYANMPGAWNSEQRSAVVDLMKARKMIQVEGEQFILRNGDTFLTQDGEKPDYKGAIDLVGKTLGLPMSKQGVELPNVGEKAPREYTTKQMDESLLKTDSKYRSAYTQIRTANPTLPRSSITDKMIRDKIGSMENTYDPGLVLRGANYSRQQSAKK